MQVGFTLDEKIFNLINPRDLLEKSKQLKVNSIEMSPDKNILPVKNYMDIARICTALGMAINFHVPYFANDFSYEIMNIKEYSKEIKSKYIEFINLIRDIQDITTNVPIIIFHGAKYIEDNKKKEGIYNTLTFFEWLLNFTMKKNIQMKFALEIINKEEKRVVGDTREDVLNIIDTFNSKNFKICWDICHDSINYYPGKESIDKTFYEKIIYSHIHGIKSIEGPSHISIIDSFLDFQEQLNFLISNKYKGILNIELLVKYCGNNYLKSLFKDIDYINCIKK